jgi:16S rRNA (guanine966-N2)-methyltransferase
MLARGKKLPGKIGSVVAGMRVITGIAKGRRLESVKGLRTRPTADRVKESLFSILGDRVSNAPFLDLFAGSGAIGIEALSRGAPKAVFVDNAKAAVQVIRRNLQRVGLASFAEIYNIDVKRAIAILAKRELEFGCIFMDPPYAQGKVVETLIAVGKSGLIGTDTLIVAEHCRSESVPEKIDILRRVRVQTYGDTEISFLIRQDSIA